MLRHTSGEIAFHPIDEDYSYSLKAGRAYLSVPSSSSKAPLKIVCDDEEVTGIEAVNCDGVDNGDAYNLQGIKVDSNYKGFVIKNGNKFFNR